MDNNGTGERGSGSSSGGAGGRVCRVCGRTEGTVGFAPNRLVCHPCRDRFRRNKAVPVAPAQTVDEPAKTPLETATAAHAAQRQARNLATEHRALVEEVQRLRAIVDEATKVKSPEFIVYDEAREDRSDATACAMASDFHVEEEVDPGAVNGLNAYDLDVARARAQNFFKNTLKLTNIFAREQKITTIDIQALGDFFSGWIHEELVANTLLAPGDAATEFARIFASGIKFLLDNSSYKITGIMLPGNHGRMTHHMHFGDPTGTSLETVAYHAIVNRFENEPRVQIDVAKHAFVYRRFYEDFVVRHIHGYEVRYGGGVGGLTIPLNKKIARWDTATKANLTTLGHFHQRVDGGNFLVNGSLIGHNTFAQAIGCSYEPPQQVFYLIDARGGGQKTVVAPIFV